MSTDWPKRDVLNELKRGWKLAAERDPIVARVPGEPNLVLRRTQPASGGRVALGLIHKGVDFKKPGVEGVQLEYFLQQGREDFIPLPEAAWADWDRKGRMLMATHDGELAVYECKGTQLNRVWSEDFRNLNPDPQPAPGWAGRW
jgi:hypothetical protein